MARFYSNITLQGPAPADIVTYLKERSVSAYVSPATKNSVVVFHEDMGRQEAIAGRLSKHFSCPVLLAMVFGETVLLYTLYVNGEQTDSYVSSPHDGLELDAPAPAGNSAILCAAFEADRFERRVESILRKEAKPDQPYALAANRHGELFRALGLPLFAVGAGFADIELGEMPMGTGFRAADLVRTG